jgi:TM2 domain-containing membrane protein YozV
MESANDTHLKSVGYVLWLFGFTGAHRFYFGKPISGRSLDLESTGGRNQPQTLIPLADFFNL